MSKDEKKDVLVSSLLAGLATGTIGGGVMLMATNLPLLALKTAVATFVVGFVTGILTTVDVED